MPVSSGQNYRSELELGYGLSMSQLVQIHTSFKSGARHHQSSSVQALAARSAVSLGQVIFGANSFGALLSARSKGSAKAFPSPASPPPGVVDRLSVSAFTARRYGVGQPGVAAIQLEVPWAPRSGNDALMRQYVTHLANAIADFRYTWLQC